MSESSIETLEMRIAYQDATIEQLSDLVYAQSREIDRLHERYQQLDAQRPVPRAAGKREGNRLY